jgi:hypothetical protein
MVGRLVFSDKGRCSGPQTGDGILTSANSKSKRWISAPALSILSTLSIFFIAAALCAITPPVHAVNFDEKSILNPDFSRLEGEKYSALGNPYLIWESIGSSSDGLRMMLVCREVGEPKAGARTLKDVRLLLVSEDKGLMKAAQQFKLGDGASPQILAPGSPNSRDVENPPDPGRDTDFMVRIMRGGNNTEAYVYSFDPGAATLKETLRVGRSFPVRLGVKVRGTLETGGFAEVETVSPDKKGRVDLAEAVNALIEDGLYQLNARPIPSMRSLTCVRNGWEGEGLYASRDGPEVRVGMTLITPSRKQVINVTAILTRKDDGKWAVTDYLFEPFLPYRS